MKRITCALLLCWSLGTAAAAELTWHTDSSKAIALAKEQDKKVLINFTGSDWCGFCKVLDKEVYRSKEFAKYAADNLVLVVADFPRTIKQSDELKKQNLALREKYAEDFGGYPTNVVLDESGKKLGEIVGYRPGSGAAAFIKQIEDLRKKS